MKALKVIALTVVTVIVFVFVAHCIADDYRNGDGIFMSDATYREYVKEGHR